MRLGQFSCSNHDEGSSAMMASLCIHNKNSDNNQPLQPHDLSNVATEDQGFLTLKYQWPLHLKSCF